MRSIKWAGLLGLSLIAEVACAATTWSYTVNNFLDGATVTPLAKNVQGWSTTGGTGGATGTLQAACLHDYGGTNGWGIVNTAEANPCTNEPGTGPHAADNNGPTDMFLLQFASAVTLTQVKLGWNGTDNYSADSDISVLAYRGTSNPAPIGGLTVSGTSSLLSNNWQLIGNYANVGSLTGNSQTISTTVASSWWLVSAYNSGWGTGTNLGGSNDYFKLLSVAGTQAAPPPPPNQTPEPASLALASLALIGLAGSRRRRHRLGA